MIVEIKKDNSRFSCVNGWMDGWMDSIIEWMKGKGTESFFHSHIARKLYNGKEKKLLHEHTYSQKSVQIIFSHFLISKPWRLRSFNSNEQRCAGEQENINGSSQSRFLKMVVRYLQGKSLWWLWIKPPLKIIQENYAYP